MLELLLGILIGIGLVITLVFALALLIDVMVTGDSVYAVLRRWSTGEREEE